MMKSIKYRMKRGCCDMDIFCLVSEGDCKKKRKR